MSLRIRSKSGDVIDLAELRKYIEFVRAGESLEMRTHSRIEHFSFVLDGLEAVLSVPEERYGSDRHHDMVVGANHMRRTIRQAAGLIEEAKHERT